MEEVDEPTHNLIIVLDQLQQISDIKWNIVSFLICLYNFRDLYIL